MGLLALLLVLLVGFCAFCEWFFVTRFWWGLKSGVYDSQHGPIRREENPILCWMTICMLCAWTVSLPPVVLFVVVYMVRQIG